MWFPAILLLAGVAVAASDYKHAWDTETEYEYLVHSRTVAGLDKLKEQYTGLQIKAKLIVQVKSSQTLQVKLSNPQYARLHTTLEDGPNTELPDQTLEYQPIPMLGKPFEVTIKNGVIRDLFVERDIPVWELNLLKSIISQLQIDTQGENAIGLKSAQIPVDEDSSLIFTAIEDSVSGKCEVLYEIVPLQDAQDVPIKIPLPDLLGEGRYYYVRKVKNYEKCYQRQVYHHGLEDPLLREQRKLYKQDKFISELSTTHVLLSGSLKEFTIQSVITKNQISVKPEKTDPFLGNVHSTLKLTLLRKNKISSPLSLSESINLESIGNLMYTFNNPLSDSENPILPSVSINSEKMQSSEKISPSEKIWDDPNSSSSSSSSEERILHMRNILPKTAIHLAPKNPLLPLTVNTEHVKDLIHEIAATIRSSNDTKLSSLEKYIFLKNLIRIMNLKQIGELEERLLYNHNIQDEDYKNIVWSIIRDAVVQTGTGPSLLTIQNWLRTKKVEGLEAATIISQIPKYVLEPTKEYVRTVFEIITDPLVLHQTAVNVVAPLAFAEVLRKSRDDTYHRSPSLRRLRPVTLKDDTEIVDTFIPHLTEQLKKNLLENNSPKIQTYITALGLTGHPSIISIFEPYIEGTEPEKVSKFQRLLMVSSLSTLSRYLPKLVGPILYKLYLNVHEDHKIRCMAIHRYIMINPPLITLQRIAKFTNDDLNDNVNSAVKSTITSLANTKRPELQDLAIKARSVRHLLNRKEFSKWNSRGLYADLDFWGIRGFSLQTINDDGIIPAFLHVAVNTAFDFYGLPTVETEYAVSSVKQLLDHWNWNTRENREPSQELLKKSRIEKFMQMLQLKSSNLNKLEGHVFLNTIYNLLFYPFDSQTLRKISSQLRDSLTKNHKLDLLVFNNYETILSFPIESGLPFLYTLESPISLKLKAEIIIDESSITKRTGVLNLYVANKVQKQFGFAAPFENQNYIAGVHVNRMWQLPLEYEVQLNSIQQKLDIGPLKLRLQTETSPITVLHLSTIPFTTRQDLLDLQPLSLSRNTHLVLTERKHKSIIEKDLISILVETDNKEEEETLQDNDILELWLKLRAIPDGQYKSLDILMNPEQLAKSVLHTNVIYEKMAIDNKLQLFESESQIMFPLKQVKPNSEKRRKEVFTGFSKRFKSGDVSILDVNLNLPELERQQVLTVGWINSNLDKKSKLYLYWNSQKAKEKPTSEVCYTHEIQNSPETPLNFKYTMRNAPKDKIKAELQYGESCSRGNKIVVDSSLSRSDRIKDLLENSKVVKQCLEEIEKGHNALQACQQATELAQVKNQLNLSIGGSITDYIKKIISKVSDFLSHLFPLSQIKATNWEDSDSNTFDINMILSPLDIILPAYLDSSQTDITFPNMEQTHSEMQELLKENTMLLKEAERASCTIDKNMVLTFDKLLYPVTMGTCKHVLTTTYPYEDPDTRKNITDTKLFVAIVEDAIGTKKVFLLLDEYDITLKKLGDDFAIEVEDVPIQLSQSKDYQLRDDNSEIILEIRELPDGSLEVTSDRSDVKIVFEGERIQLLVANKYRNALRGLCGNYDFDPNTDFLTPWNCLMKVPEVFTATYALPQENCQKGILENKQKAELTPCQELPIYQRNNVINDIEAGRSPIQGELWGYHNKKHDFNYDSKKYDEKKDLPVDSNLVYRTKVILEDEEICFTTKPIPMCREGTRSLERKTKKYNLYCQPKNEESLLMKRRIEQGANPDFTRKPFSRLYTFQIPVLCTA